VDTAIERSRPGDGQDPARQSKVELRSVGLRYLTMDGETEALRGVSLAVQPGEFVSIVGQSGCGKSTLLSLIAGIMPATEGDVLVDGRPVSGPSPQVAYMLQSDYLFEWRTIFENVMLGPEIQGLDIGRARERAKELLHRYGLGDFMSHYPHQLSGGMRQRAALARTLVTEPDILLLDEPFSALDFQTRLALSDEVGIILRREQKTVILVTHDISEAISMTDRVVVMTRRPGRIRAEHEISFPSAGAERPTPFNARNTQEFGGYFDQIWNELDIYVGG
jgi:NitT/TauT family transport system ATP-binding protein